MKRPDCLYTQTALAVFDDGLSTENTSVEERDSSFVLDGVREGLATARNLVREARVMVQKIFSEVQLLYDTGAAHSSWIQIVRDGARYNTEAVLFQQRLSQLRYMLSAMENPSRYNGRVPTSDLVSDNVFVFDGHVEIIRTDVTGEPVGDS